MDSLNFDAAGYLIDLDGTLISGRQALPDALWLLEQVAGRFMLVSNDAEHTPEQLSRMLRPLGLAIRPERIVLAGMTAVDTIATDYPGASVMLLGSSSLRAYARRRGLWLDGPKTDVVLVMRDRKFSYAKLAAAADAVHRGARLVAACPDTSHPGPLGQPVPETGALAAAILSVAGPAPMRVIGKPEPILFEAACARLGIAPRDAVMVGDNPATDGQGASRLGMTFWQVRHGRLRGNLNLVHSAPPEAVPA